MAWADLDGDGELELVNAPLIGPGSLAPTYDQDRASIFWYGQDGWRRHTRGGMIRWYENLGAGSG